MTEILEEVKKMENQQKQTRSEVMKLCWYMRGGMTLDEGFASSYEDRLLLADIVKENLEITKKSGMPFF